MSRTIVDIDEASLIFAQRQLGTSTKRETINKALALAAGVSADDRARGLKWLQDNAEKFLDFEVLAGMENPSQ